MSFARRLAAILCAGVLAGCATVVNLPVNQPTLDANAGLPAEPAPNVASEDDLLIGLAFSGGGTRAAAFSFGVLDGLAATPVQRGGRKVALTDRIDFITGVSGGSVTAAYFGLKKQAAFADFRERFLIQNAEEALRTDFSLGNLSRAFGGGVNEDVRFRAWLDAHLFDGATFSSLLAEDRPRVWINATDIYNRTPFVFGRTTFSVICSDLARYPIAAAVAASAAVPVAFAPVVLETFPERCNAQLPGWITKALHKENAPPILRAYAQGVSRYRDGTVRYIKLLDGGISDNYGLSGFTVARESSETPYGPLTAAQAVRLRRVLFLIVDAGQGPYGDWAQRLEGPTGVELVSAVTAAALDSSKRANYTAFERTMLDWREGLVRWRCSPEGQRQRAAQGGGPDCRDLEFSIGRLSFDQLSPGRAAQFMSAPTNFNLPADLVDSIIDAGREALATSSVYRAFRAGLDGKEPARARSLRPARPVASAVPVRAGAQ